MLWKCWLTYTRDESAADPRSKQRKHLAITVLGIGGIVNLTLACGGLPMLMQYGGLCKVASHCPLISHYVVHPDIFLHYLVDMVINPLLLLNMAYNPKVKPVDGTAPQLLVFPS